MLCVDIDIVALGGVRMAVSPLWETLSSLVLLVRHPDDVPWPYDGWARIARRALRREAAASIDVMLAEICRGELPAFLAPPPAAPEASIEEELSVLLGQAEEAVQARARQARSRALRPFETAPAPALARYAEGVHAYWDRAVRPHWPLLRAALSDEISFRARYLATDGPAAVLAGLKGRVRWAAPELRISMAGQNQRIACHHRLTLVPAIFGRSLTLVATDPTGGVAISYQARGVAAVLTRMLTQTGHVPADAPERADPLAILIGGGRATVMRALVTPTTTTALARGLGLAASTVSEHLATLVAAGVARRRRSGSQVLYELSHHGVHLLGLR
jgi:DNA-binding transcriptional ArsR family regulator